MTKMLKKLLIGFLIIFNANSEAAVYDAYETLSWPLNHLTITNGFFNCTTVKQLFYNLPQSFNKKTLGKFLELPCDATDLFVLSVWHLIYQLTKIGFQYSREITGNKSWFVNIKFYSFDYGLKNLFISKGSGRFDGTFTKQHICIVERISWFSAHGGLEYKYLTRDNYTLSWSWAAGLSFPTGWPDGIFIITPFILRHNHGFFCRLQLVQFSILNLISNIRKTYKAGETIPNEKIIQKKYPKFTCGDFVENTVSNILYNITFEIGIDFSF